MPGLDREQLIALVKRVQSASACEMDLDALLTQLESNVPHPQVTGLIFHHPQGRELTAEEVVDTALAYEPADLQRD